MRLSGALKFKGARPVRATPHPGPLLDRGGEGERRLAAAQSAGLGDTVAKVTQAVRADKAMEWLAGLLGMPCGCAQRREWLNKKVPYRKRAEGRGQRSEVRDQKSEGA